MNDDNEHIREFIQRRLAALEEETDRLRSALSSLDGAGDPRPRRGRPPKDRPTSKKGKRAPRGQRPQQLLEALSASPDATLRLGQIAERMGVPPQQARTIARRLEIKGTIEQVGKGFRVAEK